MGEEAFSFVVNLFICELSYLQFTKLTYHINSKNVLLLVLLFIRKRHAF